MVVVIPWIILFFTGFSAEIYYSLRLPGVIIFAAGLIVFLPAHWQVYKPEQWLKNKIMFLSAEPNELVTDGIYHYIQNPQLVGIYLMLVGEAMFFQSWALFYYLVLVLPISALVSVKVEEPQLERRFGDSYRLYADRVKRFIPKLF